MADLTARAIADLREQLAATQAELEQQRTRAEAAEQELRESSAQREIEKRVLWSCWEWFDDHDDRKTSAEIHHELQQVVGEWHGRVVDESGIAHFGAAGLAAKLAAIRAHLQGVDVDAVREAIRHHDYQGLSHTPLPHKIARSLEAAAREALANG